MIRPLSDRILVKPIENKESSKGGVYIPKATTTFVADRSKCVQTTIGKVIAIGSGNPRKPDVRLDSIVVFSDTCGKRVKHENEEYLFIREQDVIGFLNNEVNVELVYRD